MYSSGCRIYLQVGVGCIPSGCGMYFQWVWDVFPVEMGYVHAASHLSHMWDQPGIHAWSVGQADPSRAKPVTAFLVLLSPDRTELQRAMEHNSRLDKEILALRARVQTLDLERKAFLELVRIRQANNPGLAPGIHPYSQTCPAFPFPLPVLCPVFPELQFGCIVVHGAVKFRKQAECNCGNFLPCRKSLRDSN